MSITPVRPHDSCIRFHFDSLSSIATTRRDPCTISSTSLLEHSHRTAHHVPDSQSSPPSSPPPRRPCLTIAFTLATPLDSHPHSWYSSNLSRFHQPYLTRYASHFALIHIQLQYFANVTSSLLLAPPNPIPRSTPLCPTPPLRLRPRTRHSTRCSVSVSICCCVPSSPSPTFIIRLSFTFATTLLLLSPLDPPCHYVRSLHVAVGLLP